MKKYVNGEYVEMTSEEIEEMKKAQKEWEEQERHRPLSQEKVMGMILKQNIQTLNVDDNTALRMIEFYPRWKDLCDEKFKAETKGFKFSHDGKLYRTINDEFTFQSQWVPGVGTSAIFSQIVETQAGTLEDPIIVPDDVTTNAFTYVIGKYYKWNEKIYKCERKGEEEGTEYSLNASPDLLIGNYFTLVE